MSSNRMRGPVQLSKITEALEMQLDEYCSYLDTETGEVETVSDDLVRQAEECPEDEEPELPDWQAGEWQAAKGIVSTDRYLPLPSKFDLHEWDIMREFSSAVESPGIRDDLLRAIHGSGAFRFFKSEIRRHRIEQDWYAFREQALRRIAIEWYEGHGLAWE
jgi:hypothetical protein